MWARKRIDIGYWDMASAMASCLSFRQSPRRLDANDSDCPESTFLESNIAASFGNDQLMVCLSVRSGFDLALQTLAETRY